jgi:hypothetical protein
MVSISHERSVQSERRLLDVIRSADIQHLEGAWSFRGAEADTPADALATIRDSDGWCALVPATPGEPETYGLTLTRFPPAVDNSGFVGWLATTIKRRLGSGVFVVCGDNPDRGGIFDYLGYPIDIAAAVHALIDDLRASRPLDDLSLDLLLFRAAETSPTSAITKETTFEFRELDGVVESNYSGGGVIQGFLVGRREDDRVTTAHSQITTNGQLLTGTARMRIDRDASGALRLTEEFTWADGSRGRNVLLCVERGA